MLLSFLWLAAIAAVPACAVLVRAWFSPSHWTRFDLPTYLAAWAMVGLGEIFGIILLTRESIPVFIVGFWSTIGAVIIGVIWWLTTRTEQAER